MSNVWLALKAMFIGETRNMIYVVAAIQNFGKAPQYSGCFWCQTTLVLIQSLLLTYFWTVYCILGDKNEVKVSGMGFLIIRKNFCHKSGIEQSKISCTAQSKEESHERPQQQQQKYALNKNFLTDRFWLHTLLLNVNLINALGSKDTMLSSLYR